MDFWGELVVEERALRDGVPRSGDWASGVTVPSGPVEFEERLSCAEERADGTNEEVSEEGPEWVEGVPLEGAVS